MSGIQQVADVIFPTIGPLGTNVMLNGEVTNDGEMIADDIHLEDEVENMGATRMKKVAAKTTTLSGDGRKTTMAIFYSLMYSGLKQVEGLDRLELYAGIMHASQEISAQLKKMAKKITSKEQLKQVATVSSQNADIGQIVSDVIYDIGQDGDVTIEKSEELGISCEKVIGMEFEQGFVSPYMINNRDKRVAEIQNAHIVLYDHKITDMNQLVPALEILVKGEKKQQFIIIAEDFDPFVIRMIEDAISMPGGTKIVAVRTPGYGNKTAMLTDIAAMTGGKILSESTPITLAMIGHAEKVTISSKKTTILRGKGKKADIDAYVESLKAQKEIEPEAYAKEILSRRIARLVGGIAIIKVGSQSDQNLNYLKKKVQDAINAAKNALIGGVVPGGGVALVRASTMVPVVSKSFEFNLGYSMVLKAAKAPLKLMVRNAGRGDDTVIEKVTLKSSGPYLGYDIRKNSYGDMTKLGIMDAMISSKSALQNACAEAAIMLTVGCSIADKIEDKDL